MLIRFYKRRIKKLRKLAAEPDVELWALDEVHFQQHGSRCRMWVPPEVKEPVLLHAPTRKSVGYFGAVRLRDGKFIYAREEDKFNAQSCWQFLKQLRQKSLRSSKRVVIIIDNAKYHHALLHKAWREEAMPHDLLPGEIIVLFSKLPNFLILSATTSAIIITHALILARTITGMIEASTTHRFSMPRTRQFESTTPR